MSACGFRVTAGMPCRDTHTGGSDSILCSGDILLTPLFQHHFRRLRRLAAHLRHGVSAVSDVSCSLVIRLQAPKVAEVY